MAIYQIEIRSAAMPGQEEAYEEWYNGTHLGEVLEVDGFLSGQQFRLPEVSEAGHTHAAYFRVETDDPAATLATLGETFASGTMTPTDALNRSIEASALVLAPTGAAQGR
jgi:hypothetical protein